MDQVHIKSNMPYHEESMPSVLLRPCLVPKIFLQYPSHRIFEHMYKALNIVEKIINYTVQQHGSCYLVFLTQLKIHSHCLRFFFLNVPYHEESMHSVLLSDFFKVLLKVIQTSGFGFLHACCHLIGQTVTGRTMQAEL